jgi:hypothetical protein
LTPHHPAFLSSTAACCPTAVAGADAGDRDPDDAHRSPPPSARAANNIGDRDRRR